MPLILFLAAGLLCGYALPPLAAGGAVAIQPLLVLLAFLAGVSAGRNRTALRALRAMGWRVLLPPLVTALATVAAGLAAGWLLGVPARDAGAASAGFAYYSLSAGLLADLGGPGAGALALSANFLRELLCFALAPLAARLDPLCAVSLGGATSMDTTLPVVAACTGAETVSLSVLHGMVLTALVPVLVPLLYTYLP